MEAIIINRTLSGEEEEVILNLLQNQHIDIYTNNEIPEKLLKFLKGRFEISLEEKKHQNNKIFQHIINFGEHLINDVPITDLLMVENASIWHYHKFRSYFFISNLSYEIKAIENLAARYIKVKIYSDNTFLQYYFHSSNIKFILPIKVLRKTNFLAAFNYAFFFLTRVLLSILLLNKIKKKNHIIIDHSIKQPCLNLLTLKPEHGNYNLQYLFEKLDDEFAILDDLEIPKFFQGASFKLHSYYFTFKKNRFNSEYVLFWGIFSKKIKKKLKEQSIELENKYDLIKSQISDPIDQLIINYLISLHQTSKFFLFKYFSFRQFFQKHSFKSISSIDENSPRIKSIMDAAKVNNLLTFGIQHGIIHDLQPNYHFTSNDKKRNVTTDCTLVWGSYWENKLYDNANYPNNSIKITGFIRTDIIPRLKSIDDKKLFNLKEDQWMIVFASQPLKDADMRRHVAYEVFSGIKNIDNCRLVLKLHPAEMNDTEYYSKIAKDAGCSNVIINGTIDLYLLISKADIVITSFSTVGLESVFFNKPLITIDPLKQDIQSYHKDKIAFQASNNKELSGYIRGLMNGSLSFNQDVYNNYLKDQVYKIDGNVSNRCIDIIKSYNKQNQ